LNITGAGIFGGAVTATTVQSASSTALTITGNAASTWSTSAGLLTMQGAGGVAINSPNVSGASGAITIKSGNSSAGTAADVTIDTGTTSTGTPTVNIGATNATNVVIGKSGGNVKLGGSAGAGTVTTNNGALVHSTQALSDFSGGGSIGSAATTVDLYSSISVGQTTPNKTLTVPDPTASTSYGRILYVANVGTTSFSFSNTYLTAVLNPGATATLVWQNVNSVGNWTYAGSDGGSVLNQNSSAQSANFNINGNGTAGGHFYAPDFDTASGVALTIGTANATNITVGATGSTSTLTLGQSTATNTIAIGNANVASGTQTINIGTGSSSTGKDNVTLGSMNAASTTTIQGGTGAITLQTNGGSSATTGTIVKSATNNSTGAFQVQNASSVAVFNVDTSTGTVTIGSGGNTYAFSSTGLTISGTAQRTKTITLPAEYVGAVLDAAGDSSCSSANAGTMTSGYDSTNFQNYYKWVSTATAQCYDVVVRVPIPADWSSWSSTNPLTLTGYTTNTSNGLVNVQVLKASNNSAESSCNYANVTPGSTSTWSSSNSTNCTFASTTTGYSAGSVMTVRIRVTGNASSDVRIGDLVFNYNSKF
jgi:hypothetical protein